MSFGIDNTGRRGFESVDDWFGAVLELFPAPWTLAPLSGTYCGTEVVDARGVPFLSFWAPRGEPSERMKAWLFGEEFTEERWREWLCDTHWESSACLALAELAVYCRNVRGGFSGPVLGLIFTYGRWLEAAWPEIACGGPERRRLAP